MKVLTTAFIPFAIKGLTITDDGPTTWNDTTNFTINAIQQGTDSCFFLDLGDGTKMCFGTRNICSVKFPGITFQAFEGFPILVKHKYRWLRTYNSLLIGTNIVSSFRLPHAVVMVPAPCRFPDIELLKCGESLQTAVKIYKSVQHTIKTVASISCGSNAHTLFEWKAGPLLDYKKELFANGTVVDNRTSEVTLKPLKDNYQYNFYKIEFKLAMRGFGYEDVYTTKECFVEVIRTPLHVRLQGGSMVRHGTKAVKLKITFVGTTFEKLEDHDKIVIAWMCRRSEERFPVNSSALDVVEIPPSPTLPGKGRYCNP